VRRELRGVAALVCLFAAIYALSGLFRHWHFGSSFDLAIYDQAVWHLSRFEIPRSTVRGFENIFGDHFHPVITLFAPLYWIAPRSELLITAQAILFAISIVPVFLFLRRRLSAGPSLALAAAYGLFWGLQRAADFDVHEIAFAPLIIAMAILAMDSATAAQRPKMDGRRWLPFWACVVAITLVKEDLIPLVPFMGLYLILQGERRKGASLIVLGVAAFLLVVGVLIPFFGDGGYGYTGPYRELLRRPWMTPAALVTPPAKMMTALLWLAPFVLLPLWSPLGLLLIPIALSRLASDVPLHWSTTFHYSAPLAPILVMSAGDGLSRLARRCRREDTRQRLLTSFSACSVVLSLFLPGNQPFWDLFEAEHYRLTPVHRVGYEAMGLIPPDASVVAQTAVLAHLSGRDEAFVLRPDAPDADIVIAARDIDPWPQGSFEEIAALLSERESRGYERVFDEGGWVVLRLPLAP
jgi:uncharacterized membrane protein